MGPTEIAKTLKIGRASVFRICLLKAAAKLNRRQSSILATVTSTPYGLFHAFMRGSALVMAAHTVQLLIAAWIRYADATAPTYVYVC